MLWAHYEETVKWRMLYLAWTRKGDAAHTVLVTDIPGTVSGTVIGRINDACPPPPLISSFSVVLSFVCPIQQELVPLMPLSTLLCWNGRGFET
jgi:hypothetical protein